VRLLVCFVDPKTPPPVAAPPATAQEAPRVAELERELETTRTELQVAIRDFEVAVEEQKVINEEALSGNEEYQSTNEELLTSKEELQSLNEELAALNSQLQETLERQRTTSNDLQNILYSTDVATLFLDSSFYIRFFTPATKSLFNVIPSDIGRPLADLSSLAADGALLNDAQTVLTTLVPLEREVEAQNGAWYIRRILPYHTQDNGVEGVVITFVDITERRHTADALETAKGQAEQASTVKSRFLAAASHDLRQPLQTLTLLQGQLDKTVEGDKANRLVARFEKTLGAMSGMLNTLLDINQIEASAVRAELVRFPINELLERLRDEFTYHAQANGLALRVVPCGLSVRSDPRLLEQILRNLLSNALKYTRQGSVLLGCRRHDGMLNVEVWDTGVGIPDDELQSIFEEYYQVDNPARERSHGLGLGLSIVQRLANLLGHRVRVRSRPGKGTVFAIEVALPPDEATPQPGSPPRDVVDQTIAAAHLTGAILVIEDDPEVSDILELLLKDGGHRTVIAPDGVAALELVENGTFRPNLVLADYNLPNGLNGVQVTAELRARLQRDIPVIILTGDISTATLRDIALQHCLHLNKPVRLKELTEAIQRLLARSPEAVGAPIPVSVQAPIPGSGQPPGEAPAKTPLPVVHVVDDDGDVREALRSVLEDAGLTVQAYPSGEAFLAAYRPGGEACVVLDGYLPGMSGLEVLRRLHDAGHLLPVIMITGSSDVSMAVQAMKAGAADFIEKPVRRSELLTSIQHALDQIRDSSLLAARRENAGQVVAGLTPRQRQIMDMVLAGFPSKNIAADLGISQRTVENHRAAIMKKTAVKSLPALARLAMAAVGNGVDGSVSQRPPAVGVAT